MRGKSNVAEAPESQGFFVTRKQDATMSGKRYPLLFPQNREDVVEGE
jgi:hypothetical protein